MSYSRLDPSEDIWNNRNFEVDTFSDLASIPARHGDLARATDTGIWYLYAGGGWIPLAGTYETGTWTPTLTFGGSSTGIVYGTQLGNYIRIGDLVIASFNLILDVSSVLPTGDAQIVGLPFTAGILLGTCQITNMTSMTGLTGPIQGYVDSGTTLVILFEWISTGISTIDDTMFTTTSAINGVCIYQV